MVQETISPAEQRVIDAVRALRQMGRIATSRAVGEAAGMTRELAQAHLGRLAAAGAVIAPGTGSRCGFGTPDCPAPQSMRERVIAAARAIMARGERVTPKTLAREVGSCMTRGKANRWMVRLRSAGVVPPAEPRRPKPKRRRPAKPRAEARAAPQSKARRFDPMEGVNRRIGEGGGGLVKTATVSRPAAERQYEARTRDCLMCGTAFRSAWPGERVCPACKQTDAWASGEAVHVGGAL